MTFEQWLAAEGYSVEDTNKPENAKQRKHLEAAWKAETQPAPTPTPPAEPTVEDKLAIFEANAERCVQITAIADTWASENQRDPEKIKQLRELRESALADKAMTVEKFQLAMHRFGRSVGPMVLAPKAPQVTGGVLEAAVCAAGGLQNPEKSFDAQTLEIAHKQFKAGIGLLELVGLAAKQNGFHGNVKRDLRGALRAAWSNSGQGEMMGVGPSTYDISGILSNVANKFVSEAFNFVENTWSRVTAIRPVSDFKQISTYSLTGDLQYEKVAPGGALKHGTLGETSYTNQADTYGKLLGIDRRDYINDDLGALANASRRLGRGGALKLNEVFWTEFMDNASFYSTGNLNYDDGASDTAMDLTGLANAHKMFMMQIDPNGKPMGTDPRIVLVPPALWPAAWTLTMSTDLNLATSAAAATGTKSPWTGMFRLETSRYLANTAISGYSVAAWYMLADPNDVPVIETVFLNGQQMPTIETADMDFERLGTALRGYHDFGVSKQEYRGGVKMKGEN